MADDSQGTQQLDPSFDYAKLPDGSMAKFKKGTSQDEMRAKLTASGLLKAPTQTPQGIKPVQPGTRINIKPDYQLPKNYGFTPENMIKNAKEGAIGAVKGIASLGKDLASNKDWFTGPNSTAQKFVYGPADEQLHKAITQWNDPAGRKSEAVGHATAAVLPMIGPWVAGLSEQAGTGDIGGAASNAAATALTFKAGEVALGKVVDNSLTNAAKNKAKIIELNQHALKMSEGGVKDPAAYAALRVAKEGIHGDIEKVHLDLHNAVRALDAPKEAAINESVAKGVKIPASTGADMVKAIQDIQAEAAKNGTLNPTDHAALNRFVEQLRWEPDPVTGKPAQIRDWTNLKKVYDVTRTKGVLSDEAEFDKTRPDIVNAAARKIRGIATEAVGKASPKAGQIITKQSELVRAREAANDLVTQSRKGQGTTFRGIMNSGVAPLVAWITARELFGTPAAVALGGVIIFKRLVESTHSRTLQAALRAKLLDMQERAANAIQGPQRPRGANMGGSPTSPQTGPQMPANRGLAPGQMNLPGGGPQAAQPQNAAAGPSPTSPAAQAPTAPPVQTVIPPVRGTMLPEKATRARAGSGDYVKPAPEVKTPKAADKTVAPSNTSSEGVSAKTKAMLDRFDALLDRTPKSGAENNAIKREIAEIKKLLSGEAEPKEAAAIQKRIADRERLATKRAEAGTARGAGEAGTSGEGVSKTATPDVRMSLLEQGYAKLSTMGEDGPEYVKALKKTAKELQGTDYDEVSALADAINVLNELKSHEKE